MKPAYRTQTQFDAIDVLVPHHLHPDLARRGGGTGIVGFYAWQRRGKPGATALAALMWLFALWSMTYAAELGMTSETAVDTLYEIRTVLFLPVAPLWLILVLQYTGREAWLIRAFTALLSVLPLVTLALIFTNEDHGLVWTLEGVQRTGSLLMTGFAYGVWF